MRLYTQLHRFYCGIVLHARTLYLHVLDQPRHHAATTFQNELRELLRRHELTWDERFVWD
jgi:hypothetical protein